MLSIVKQWKDTKAGLDRGIFPKDKDGLALLPPEQAPGRKPFGINKHGLVKGFRQSGGTFSSGRKEPAHCHCIPESRGIQGSLLNKGQSLETR